MPIAYWCVLAAAFLPYVWVVVAKAGPAYDNRAPRAQLAQATGYRQRANWAQLNAFEAFAPFAAGVIIAQVSGAAPAWVNALALAFIGFRILHGICYVLDWATPRSLAWAGGFACVIGLFLAAARVIG
ncbi:MAG: MAPEG family protein [Burkholderiales bacterium]